MLGRKASLKDLKAKLLQLGIINVRTTEFFQGRTTRWGIAWSFSEDGFQALKVLQIQAINCFRKKKQLDHYQLTKQCS